VSSDAKIVAVVLVAAFLIVGGYFASGHLSGASAASGGPESYVLQTTITKVVTVREHGRTVVKRVPVVVRRTIVHSSTAYGTVIDTRVVTTPGGVRYLTRKVVRYVPVVHKRTVVVNGKTRTVTETRLVPTVKTQTLTNVQTITNQSTVVVNRTNTVTQPVTTVETHTVTLPPETVTQTQTQTETETVVQTVTETEPAITITLPLP
jgi:hypothetical protein